MQHQPRVTLVGPANAPLASALDMLFARYGLRLSHLPEGAPIPGSYWGAPEAGLLGDRLYVRSDTPVNSALHEGCHFLCMDDDRRATLDTDAGGEPLEECAVCYLSVLLADRLPGFDRRTMLLEMDRWGYGFRLGSATRWFEEDAVDARAWLVAAGWVDRSGSLTLPAALSSPRPRP